MFSAALCGDCASLFLSVLRRHRLRTQALLRADYSPLRSCSEGILTVLPDDTTRGGRGGYPTFLYFKYGHRNMEQQECNCESAAREIQQCLNSSSFQQTPGNTRCLAATLILRLQSQTRDLGSVGCIPVMRCEEDRHCQEICIFGGSLQEKKEI